MVRLKNILLTGILLLSIYNSVNGGFLDGWKHRVFFARLSESEKQALMSLTISTYAANLEKSENSEIFPLPEIKPNANEIPRSLFAKMMNGGVTNKWMEEFINWLKQAYGFTDEDFKRYSTSLTSDEDKLCRGESNEDCIELGTLRSSCCPFG